MNLGHLRKVVFLRLAFEIFKGTLSLVYIEQKIGFVLHLDLQIAACLDLEILDSTQL